MLATKLKTSLNVKTRLQLCMETTLDFLKIAEDNGFKQDFYYSRLDEMINLRLVEKFQIVGSKNNNPILGISLFLNWDEHDRLSITFGDDVCLDSLSSTNPITQKTYDSIKFPLQTLRKYITANLSNRTIDRLETWYVTTDKAQNKYSEERLAQLLNIPIKTQTQKDQTSQEWSKIYKAEQKDYIATALKMADLSEISLGVWKKRED